MHADGWWWRDASLTNKAIKRQILREMLAARFGSRRRQEVAAAPAGAAPEGQPSLAHAAAHESSGR
jgi:hypothetical protein